MVIKQIKQPTEKEYFTYLKIHDRYFYRPDFSVLDCTTFT